MKRAGLLAIAAAAVIAVAVLTTGHRAGGYTLTAEFSNAAGLSSGFAVKRDGVPVGAVTAVRLSKHDQALVSFTLDAGAYPIGRRARFLIRPSNLLGEQYIDIENAAAGRALSNGAFISDARTGTPAQLNDVIDMLNPPTRVALGVVLSESGVAVAGRGENLATILRNTPRSLDEAQQTLADLDSNNAALERVLDHSDQILSALTPQRRALANMIVNANGTFGALAERDRSLAETIRVAGPAVHQATRSLALLAQAAEPLGIAAQGLRSTAQPLTAALRATPGFVAQARPTIAAAGRLAPSLTALLDLAVPVVHRLLPTADLLVSTVKALGPVSQSLESSAPDTFAALEDLGRAGQDRDTAGHYVRGTFTAGSDAVSILNQLLAGQSTAAARHQPDRSSARTGAPAATSDSTAPGASATSSSQRPTGTSTGAVASPIISTVKEGTASIKSLLGYLLKP